MWVAGLLFVLGLIAFGYVKIREVEERRQAAQADSERMKELDQTRRDLKEFRRLADEARFYMATTDPVTEQAPYFDPLEGAARTRAALAIAEKWGSAVERLPLAEEIDAVRKELYDIILLLVQSRLEKENDLDGAREALGLLEKAERFSAPSPSRSYYRLRAQAYRRTSANEQAIADQFRAEDSRTQTTALDHFLLGERYRKEAAGLAQGQTTHKAGRADEVLTTKAIAEYRQAMQIEPNHYWSHLQVGRCYLSVGRYPEALAALSACVALQPESPWGYSVRGTVLVLLKHYAEAEQDLESRG